MPAPSACSHPPHVGADPGPARLSRGDPDQDARRVRRSASNSPGMNGRLGSRVRVPASTRSGTKVLAAAPTLSGGPGRSAALRLRPPRADPVQAAVAHNRLQADDRTSQPRWTPGLRSSSAATWSRCRRAAGGGTRATPRQSPRFAYTRSPCRDRGSPARTQASPPHRDQPDARSRRGRPPTKSRATVIARRRKGRTYHDHFARPPPRNRRRVPPGRPGRPGRGRRPAPGHRARHRSPGRRGARHADRAVGCPVPVFHPAA
jgi:hypothetical protein